MAEKSGTFFKSAFKMLDDESAGKIFGRISSMASTIGRFIPLAGILGLFTKNDANQRRIEANCVKLHDKVEKLDGKIDNLHD